MSNFQALLNDEVPVLVDFSAEWCGPCKMLAPELEKLKKLHGDALRIIKVDVDKNPQAAAAYQVSGVPTLMLYRKGQMLWRQSGVISAQQLSGIIQNKLS